jgi:hypothetical protein
MAGEGGFQGGMECRLDRMGGERGWCTQRGRSVRRLCGPAPGSWGPGPGAAELLPKHPSACLPAFFPSYHTPFLLYHPSSPIPPSSPLSGSWAGDSSLSGAPT